MKEVSTFKCVGLESLWSEVGILGGDELGAMCVLVLHGSVEPVVVGPGDCVWSNGSVPLKLRGIDVDDEDDGTVCFDSNLATSDNTKGAPVSLASVGVPLVDTKELSMMLSSSNLCSLA